MGSLGWRTGGKKGQSLERPGKRELCLERLENGSEAEEDQRSRRVREDGQETGRKRCRRRSPRVRALSGTGAGFGAAGGLGAGAVGQAGLTPTAWSVPGGLASSRPTGEGPEGGRAGARRLARGPGRTGVGITGPYLPPEGPGSKATTSGSQRDGRSHAQSPPRKHACRPPCPRAQPEPTSLPPLGQGQRCLREPRRSRSRNPERTHPASPELAPENCRSFPLALLAAITQETRAGPPISCERGGGLLGIVVLKKMVASEKRCAISLETHLDTGFPPKVVRFPSVLQRQKPHVGPPAWEL